MKIEEHILKIQEVIDETENVKVFKVEIPENANVDFYPGQFFMVSFVDEPEIKVSRAYSIASSPANKNHLEIALDKVGVFTTKLFTKKAGDILKFKGPYGKFYFDESVQNDLVLIGGGTGIAPLIGIIRYCTDKKLDNKIKLFYSVKTPKDIIYKNEFPKLKQSNNSFDYLITITREADDWQGRKGRIDLELLKEEIANPENKLYFLCGSKEFVDSIISMLQILGVKREQIRTDVWGN